MTKTPDVQLEIAIAVKSDLPPADLATIFDHIASKGLSRVAPDSGHKLWADDLSKPPLFGPAFTSPTALAFLKPTRKSGLNGNPERVTEILNELAFIPAISGYEVKVKTYGVGGYVSHIWRRPEATCHSNEYVRQPLLPMPAERSARISPTY